MSTRDIIGVLLVGAALLLAASRTAARAGAPPPLLAPGDSTAATPPLVAGVVVMGVAPLPAEAIGPPAPPRARDADQNFLRRMLDHHEAVLAIAHAQMMAPARYATRDTAADPGDLDASLDLEKREMLALLAALYREDYSPRAARTGGTATDAAGVSAVADSGAAAAHEANRQRLAVQFRAGVALIDRFSPGLRRPSVRALAARLRETERALLGRVTADSASR